MTKLSAPSTPRLADLDTERVRREHDQKIRELQQLPSSSLRIIPNITLKNATTTQVPHGLGRVPLWVGISVSREPDGGLPAGGCVVELRNNIDRTAMVALQANGFGATIVVDVLVL